ncbi:unnamed protein product [Miscanthus lutarioriparius]|uniref:Uncharacterized protein n=1 Tax=Miscanthus lutarioriparius TaxID=422564 RepID=A0A811QVL8_9POAL|nr:unnamed protein product [Miscanthus lutarioriparius]
MPRLSPEDHEGGPEDGYATLEEDDGDQDDRGAASEDSDDDIVPFGRRTVKLLAIRANFRICAINGYDWQLGASTGSTRGKYKSLQEGMVDLVPIGPCGVLMAYGAFTLEVFHSITRAGNTTTTGNEGSSRVRSPIRKDSDVCGAPIRVEWDVCGEDDDKEPEEYTQTICCRGPGRKLEITYLVKLKLKDFGSRSRAVYGKMKASTADYGNKSVHLFSRERGRSWSVPSGPTSILPLSSAVIALPYRRQLELHIEVDLIVITIFDNQEEYKNLKFSLTFTRGIRSQEREVDDDQVEVSIAFDPEI